jgi:hypothetical protein
MVLTSFVIAIPWLEFGLNFPEFNGSNEAAVPPQHADENGFRLP